MKFDFQNLNPAEKRLILGFAALLVALVHLFGLRLILQKTRGLGDQARLLQAEKQMVDSLLGEAESWAPRENWLTLVLPPKTPETKRVLDGKVEAVAKKYSLTSQRGQVLEQASEFFDAEHYPTSLTGGWSALVEALQDLYQPAEGMAITSLEIKAVDEKNHIAIFTLSRFFLRPVAGATR